VLAQRVADAAVEFGLGELGIHTPSTRARLLYSRGAKNLRLELELPIIENRR
jgi:hypothetical protein